MSTAPPMGWPIRLPASTIKAVWMRANTPSGGKDWIGVVCPNEFVTHWGRIKNISQCKVVSTASPFNLLEKKQKEKLAKGYWMVKFYHQSTPSSASPPPPPPPPPNPKMLGEVIRQMQDEVPEEEEWF